MKAIFWYTDKEQNIKTYVFPPNAKQEEITEYINTKENKKETPIIKKLSHCKIAILQ